MKSCFNFNVRVIDRDAFGLANIILLQISAGGRNLFRNLEQLKTKVKRMFIHKLTAHVHDTDAAGVIYFANFYRMAHTTYEAFMESIGFSIRYFLDEAPCLPLIVHSEADYKKPIRTGDKLVVELNVEKVGKSSYGLAYRIRDDKTEIVSELKTVHVTVSKKDKRTIPLPEDLKKKLSEFAS